MFETFNATSGRFTKENERNLYGQKWCFVAAYSNSTTVNGFRFRHVKCYQWYTFRTDKVTFVFFVGKCFYGFIPSFIFSTNFYFNILFLTLLWRYYFTSLSLFLSNFFRKHLFCFLLIFLQSIICFFFFVLLVKKISNILKLKSKRDNYAKKVVKLMKLRMQWKLM